MRRSRARRACASCSIEGEEQARAFGKKHARSAAEASTPNALMAAGQGAAQEAVENAVAYWGQMFELIVEVQKRLFTLMEGQMAVVPGIKEAKAAMAMMPDLTQAQNVVKAMQGVVTSGRLGVRADAESHGRHGADGAEQHAGNAPLVVAGRPRGVRSAWPSMML